MHTTSEHLALTSWTIKPMSPKEYVGHGQTVYWDHYAYSESVLFEECDDQILWKDIQQAFNAFEQHEYNSGLVVKQLRNLGAQTIRINHTHRLAFTTIEVNDQRVAVFYLLILNHKLVKHRDKLKASYIQSLQASIQPILCDQLTPKRPNEASTITPPATRSPYRFREEIIADEQFIELSAEQYVGLNKKFPLMQSGVAGVGKTTLMSQRIDDLIHSNDAKRPLSILCITSTGLLADYIARDIQHDIAVRVYPDWIQSFAPTYRLTDDRTFEDWYRDYIQKNYVRPQSLKQKQNKSIQKMKAISTDTLCEAFNDKALTMENVLSTFKHFAGRDPHSVSDDDILFPPAFKAELIRAYDDFLSHLERHRLLHPAFFELSNEAALTSTHDLVSVEEGQNFTLLQIRNLFRSAKCIGPWQRAFQITYDSQQMTLFHKSHREDILHMMVPHASDIAEHHHVLHHIERSSENIVQFVDRFIALIKYPITQERADKYEDTTLSAVDSLPTQSASLEKEQHQHILWASAFKNLPRDYNYNSGRWLIITHAHHLNEARALFGHAITIQEAIGLQADYVCLYRPFDDVHFKAITTLLSTETSAEKRPVGKAKKDAGHKEYTAFLNSISLAMLRAKKMLVLVQKEEHAIRPLIERIKLEQISRLKPTIIDNAEIDLDALRSQLRALVLNEQHRAAQDMYIAFRAEQRLGLSFESFCGSITLSPTLKAAEASVLAVAVDSKDKKANTSNTKPREQQQAATSAAVTAAVTVKQRPAVSDSAFQPKAQAATTTPTASTPLFSAVTTQKIKVNEYLNKLYDSLSNDKLKKLFEKTNASSYLSTPLDAQGAPDTLNRILKNEFKAKILLDYLEQHEDALRSLYEHYTQLHTGHRLEHLAVIYRRTDLLEQLRRTHDIIHRKNASGFTAAYYAKVSGRLALLSIFHAQKRSTGFSEDQPLELFDTRADTPLHMAIDYHHDRQTYLLASVDSSVMNLLVSIENHDEKTVLDLLQSNNQLATLTFDIHGSTMLHLACQHGNSAIVDHLLAHEAQVNQARHDGTTALMIATRCRHLDVMQQLLDVGVNINATSHDVGSSSFDVSALDIALKYQFYSGAHCLLHYGAYLESIPRDLPEQEYLTIRNILDNRIKLSALYKVFDDRARTDDAKALELRNLMQQQPSILFQVGPKGNHCLIIQFSANWRLSPLLVEALKGLPNPRSYLTSPFNQNNALHYAAKFESGGNLISEVLKQCPDLINVANHGGRTPLHCAVIHRQYEHVTKFCETAFVNPNIKDNSGNTALHYAVKSNDSQIVLYLISHARASLSIKNLEDRTPVQYASPRLKQIIGQMCPELNTCMSNQQSSNLLSKQALQALVANAYDKMEAGTKAKAKAKAQAQAQGRQRFTLYSAPDGIRVRSPSPPVSDAASTNSNI